jgi:2-methylaconitate cis-trans-isomerase PrpF
MIRRFLPGAAVAIAVAFAIPGTALACAVCYGDSGSAMTVGMNNGILMLLAVVAVVQGGFVALFVSFWRRSRRLREQRDSFQLIDGGVR